VFLKSSWRSFCSGTGVFFPLASVGIGAASGDLALDFCFLVAWRADFFLVAVLRFAAVFFGFFSAATSAPASLVSSRGGLSGVSIEISGEATSSAATSSIGFIKVGFWSGKLLFGVSPGYCDMYKEVVKFYF